MQNQENPNQPDEAKMAIFLGWVERKEWPKPSRMAEGVFDVIDSNMQTELVQLLQGKTDSSMQTTELVLQLIDTRGR